MIAIGEPIPLRAVVDEHIRRVVSKCDRMKEAARILGMDESALRKKRNRLGLPMRECGRRAMR